MRFFMVLVAALSITFTPAVAAPSFGVKAGLNLPLPDPTGGIAFRVVGTTSDRIADSRFAWNVGLGGNLPISAPTHIAPRLELGLAAKLTEHVGLGVGWIAQYGPDYGRGSSIATGPGVGPAITLGQLKCGATLAYGWVWKLPMSGEHFTGWSLVPWTSWIF